MAMPIPAIEIETVYRGQVHYDKRDKYDDTFYDKVSKFAHNRKDVRVSETSAGPAWNGYFVVEGTTTIKVQRAVDQIVRYILRFKGAEIL